MSGELSLWQAQPEPFLNPSDAIWGSHLAAVLSQGFLPCSRTVMEVVCVPSVLRITSVGHSVNFSASVMGKRKACACHVARGGLSDLSALCNSGGMKMKMVSRQKAAINPQRSESPAGETQWAPFPEAGLGPPGGPHR